MPLRLSTTAAIVFSLCALVCPVVPMSRANVDSFAGWASPLHTCSEWTCVHGGCMQQWRHHVTMRSLKLSSLLTNLVCVKFVKHAT